MGQTDRQHTVLPFQRLQPLHETLRRGPRGVHDHGHAAIGHRRHGPPAVRHLRCAQVDQLEGALQDVGVRILLEGDQQVGMRQHGRAEVVVRVQLGADHHAGAHQLPHAGEQVALAIGVAIGHHRAVQAQQHQLHRQRGLQVGQDLVTQGLVSQAGGGAAGLGGGHQAFDQGPAMLTGALAGGMQRAAEHAHPRWVGAARPVSAVDLERRQPGRHGRKGVGLGGQAGGEHAHGGLPRCKAIDGSRGAGTQSMRVHVWPQRFGVTVGKTPEPG